MARRKKGQNVHGWVILDKPTGWTSTQAVTRLRRLYDAKKAGHAGTLDPLATGLLAVAFGEATKTVPYITDAMKGYEFTVRWGQATNTDDAEGEIIAQSDARPTADEINAHLGGFVGEIEQVPPAFSAVKIDGERAYAKARDGEDVTLAARPLYVDRLELIDQPDRDHAVLEMECGKGGYVRAIARDLGRVLGCHGHVTGLRRIYTGPFSLDHSAPPDVLDLEPGDPSLAAHLQPIEAGLDELPEQKVGPEGAARIRNGNPGPVRYSDLEFGEECWVSYEGQPIAVGTYQAGHVHPSRVFVYGD